MLHKLRSRVCYSYHKVAEHLASKVCSRFFCFLVEFFLVVVGGNFSPPLLAKLALIHLEMHLHP